MLNELYEEQNRTQTENGSAAFNSTGDACLDFFSLAGALRSADGERITALFKRALAENALYAVRTLFYARDVRGGLGERRLFRLCLSILAKQKPKTVEKLLPLFAEYGRFDDILALDNTPCFDVALKLLKEQLDEDLENHLKNKPVSLLAKWLPSVNTSNAASKNLAKRICKAWHITEKQYRQTLSVLRKYINIVETHLCEKDYTFPYSAVPGKALQKYRKAFIRNDEERFNSFLESVQNGTVKMNTGTIYPYELVNAVLSLSEGQSVEERELETAWNALPDYTNGENAIAVVDGSGSMYSECNGNLRPIDVALSLGIYFAERNTGHFKNHFITFSQHPRLIKIPDASFPDRVQFCASFDEIANTDLYQVFCLILSAAVKNILPQSELPSCIYIISDMEFDTAVDPDETVYEDAKKLFEASGYKLPNVVFWNVNSHRNQLPVGKSENGTVLVSGCSPTVFKMAMSDDPTPEAFMYEVLNSPRYANITVE